MMRVTTSLHLYYNSTTPLLLHYYYYYRWEDMSVSRQTMYDETYFKIPTEGWMFLPLVDYHGGGDEAAFEPLLEHIVS